MGRRRFDVGVVDRRTGRTTARAAAVVLVAVEVGTEEGPHQQMSGLRPLLQRRATPQRRKGVCQDSVGRLKAAAVEQQQEQEQVQEEEAG